MATLQQEVAAIGAMAGETWSTAKINQIATQIQRGQRTIASVVNDVNVRIGNVAPAKPAPAGETAEERAAREAAERQKAASEAEGARRERDIYSAIQAKLAEYEIDDPAVMQLIKQLIQDDAGVDEVMLKIRETAAWKTRFAGNEERRARGLNQLSPAEYIAYEREARQLMREAAMPAGFFDSNADFVSLIGRDISARELSRRIQNGYVKVSQAPMEIRQAFSDYFGANGDAALASLFLNFDKGVDVLERHVAAAEFGGTARRFGFADNQVIAERAAELGIDRGRAEQGMGELIDINHLFRESVTEADDLVAEREGFGSVFGFTPGDTEKIRRRREQRIASASGSTSGAMITREGVLGFRTASTNE